MPKNQAARQQCILTTLFGVCLFVLAAVGLAAPRLTSKEPKQSEPSILGGERCETVVRFEEKIYIEQGSFSLTVEYGQIQRIYKRKHLCVRMLGRQNAILIDPKGVAVGTW